MRSIFCLILAGYPIMCTSCASTDPLSAGAGVRVIAHRGDSQAAPENTLASFRSALSTGANYVELDARPSADGTLYVLHDATLDRTTNAVRVLGRTKVAINKLHDKQIDELDAGTWFNAKFAGERVPTLASALDAIQTKSQTLLEHKAGSAEAYARLLREKGLIGKLIVQSFDWEFLAQMHKLEPGQTLAALGEKKFDETKWARLPATGARIVAWSYKDLDAELVARLHNQGYKVVAWTPDKQEEWTQLISFGVDGIITNRPGDLVQLRRGNKREIERPVE